MSRPECLDCLEPFLWPGSPWDDTPLSGTEAQFEWVGHGRRYNVTFICTVDIDGQIELSLVKYDSNKRFGMLSKRCSLGEVKAFCKNLGLPVHEIAKRATTWHLVIVKGAGVPVH